MISTWKSSIAAVEQLLHHLGQAVDLVDEEHVALFQVGEDAHQVAAALQRRAGGALELHAQLVAR